MRRATGLGMGRMDHRDIYALLHELIGVDLVSIGEEAVDRVIKGRMKAGGHDSIAAYCTFLSGSASERQAFINEVTVPETWFFRDSEPFRLLADFASRVWPPATEQQFRVLSIPCSTGEEPYSIAMVLLSAGFAPGSFVIDAADISTRVLELARRGIYGRNSFRGGDLSFREQYFTEKGGFYEVADEVKQSVNFHHHNVLSPDFMQGEPPYNIIFCRNLLIYFDMETKERVIRLLHRLLHPDGLLFLGHAETGRMVHGVFESLRHPGAFAYRPVDARGSEHPGSGVAPPRKPLPAWALPAIVTPAPPAAEASAATETETAGPALDEIQALADRGELKGAMQLCRAYIQRNPLAADGYYLLGIIQLAQEQDGDALAAFKRAIYLEPGHYQSLVHLQVLAEAQGDMQAAANYRARMERARAKS